MPCYWEWKPPCAFPCLWKCWIKWFKPPQPLNFQKERVSHMLQCGFHIQWEMGIACLQTKVLICPQSSRQRILSRLLLWYFWSETVCFSSPPVSPPLLVFWVWSPNFSLLWAAGASGNKLKCLHFHEKWCIAAASCPSSAAPLYYMHMLTHTPCVYTHLDRWWCSEQLLQFLLFFYNPWLECQIL